MTTPPAKIAAPEDRFNVRAEAAKVTPADALDAAKRFFPGGAEKVTLLAGGFSNANYRIDTAQGPFVLRFFWNGQKTGEREVAVLKHCERHGIRVPKVIDFHSDAARTVGLIEFAKGELFSDVLAKRGNGTAIVFAAVGRQLALTHAMTFPAAGLFDTEVRIFHSFPSFPEECLNHLLTPLLPGGRARKRIGDEAADRFAAFARRHWDAVRTAYAGPCMTHCDFNPKNVIIGPNGDAVVIDWEFAMSADALIDVGNFFRFAADDYPAEAKDAFVRGYQEEGGRLPPDWERLAALVDLAAMADFLGSEADYQKTFHTARIIVDRTLARFARP